MNRRALVIGATGLVGQSLVKQILEDDRFSSLVVLGRRPTGLSHPKLTEHLVNFDRPGDWEKLVQGDVLFSALGTTLKTAGSKEAQYRVDHQYQWEVARAAAANGVRTYVLVSAAMANPESRLFYSRMKGELERDVRSLSFPHLHIFRPGMLKGQRIEFRPGEKVGLAVLKALNRLGLFKSQKPVPVETVARAMIRVSFSENSTPMVYELLDVFKAAGDHLPEG